MAGVVTSFKLKTTKKGANMAYATLEDISGAIEMLVFANALTESGGYLRDDSAVVVHGRVSAREDEEPKLICDAIHPLTEEGIAEYRAQRARRGGGQRRPPRQEDPSPRPQTLYLKVPGLESDIFLQAGKVMTEYPGSCPVILRVADTGRKMRLREERWVAPGPELLDRLKSILQPENVVLK